MVILLSWTGKNWLLLLGGYKRIDLSMRGKNPTYVHINIYVNEMILRIRENDFKQIIAHLGLRSFPLLYLLLIRLLKRVDTMKQ